MSKWVITSKVEKVQEFWEKIKFRSRKIKIRKFYCLNMFRILQGELHMGRQELYDW